MIMEPCKKMNCKLEFFNPADFLWGTLNNGTFTGHFGEVVNRKVDMVTGAIVLTYLRSMVTTICS